MAARSAPPAKLVWPQAVKVALAGHPQVQGMVPSGKPLQSHSAKPEKLAVLTSAAELIQALGSSYRVDERTVVASASAIERLLLSCASWNGAEIPTGCVATRVGPVPVLATVEEVDSDKTASQPSGATPQSTSADSSSHDSPLVLDASFRAAVRSLWAVSEPRWTDATPGDSLIGAIKYGIGPCRLLIVGTVDCLSGRIAAAFNKAASSPDSATLNVHKQLTQAPLDLWRCFAVSASATGTPTVDAASRALCMARSFAMGLAKVDCMTIAQAAAAAGAATPTIAAAAKTKAESSLSSEYLCVAPVTVPARGSDPEGFQFGAGLSRLSRVLHALQSRVIEGFGHKLCLGAAEGETVASDGTKRVGVVWRGIGAVTCDSFLDSDFAKQLCLCATAPRVVKRQRESPTVPAGSSTSLSTIVSASAPTSASVRSLEAEILASVPKGYDARRKRQAMHRERKGDDGGARIKGPVRARIAEAGPWQGLSREQWPDPMTDPRILRLRAQDAEWTHHVRSSGPAGVVIIVPFRDQPEQNRALQLAAFAKQFPQWFATLRPAPARWHVIVVEQTQDGYKFNRGKLLNVGFQIAMADKGMNGAPFGSKTTVGPATAAASSSSSSAVPDVKPFDVAIMHDVDLLPTHPGFVRLYNAPHAGPVPIAKTWSRYEYPNYIGGITGFGVPLFRKINGYPNNFWGWGGEDDDLRRRLEAVGYPPTEWVQPPVELKGKIRDLEEEFIAQRGGKRAGVGIKHGGKSETLNLVRQERLRETYNTWWRNGLNSLAFNTVGMRALNDHVTVVTVDLLAVKDKDSVKLTDLPEWARR